eukprot:5726707-Pyramimonas_sp.AAC.1
MFLPWKKVDTHCASRSWGPQLFSASQSRALCQLRTFLSTRPAGNLAQWRQWCPRAVPGLA